MTDGRDENGERTRDTDSPSKRHHWSPPQPLAHLVHLAYTIVRAWYIHAIDFAT
jgi:hypothetical protein